MMILVGAGASRTDCDVVLVGTGLRLPAAPLEFMLAVAACCWPVNSLKIRAALVAEIDWDRFLAVIAKHRVDGLVARTLSSTVWADIPEGVRQELTRRARKNAIQTAAMTREAAALSDQLSQQGVLAGVLKGSAVGVLAFGDATLRHMRDIDLLVDPDDVPAAHNVLSAAGYRLRNEEEPAPHAIAKSMSESKHLAYSQPTSQISLELHWRLYDNPYFDSSTSQASSLELAEAGFGIKLRTLPQSELLPYLCGHGGLHGWFRLKWLADVAAIVQASPQSMERLMTRSAGKPLHLAAVQAAVLSHVLFDTALPVPLKDLSWRERSLVRSAWDAMVRSNASTEPQADRFSLLRTRLSAFLLSARPAYVLSQIRVELMADDPGPTNLTRSRWKAPFRKVSRWCLRKLLPSQQRTTD